MDIFLIDDAIEVGWKGNLFIYFGLFVDLDAVKDQDGLYNLTKRLTD